MAEFTFWRELSPLKVILSLVLNTAQPLFCVMWGKCLQDCLTFLHSMVFIWSVVWFRPLCYCNILNYGLLGARCGCCVVLKWFKVEVTEWGQIALLDGKRCFRSDCSLNRSCCLYICKCRIFTCYAVLKCLETIWKHICFLIYL